MTAPSLYAILSGIEGWDSLVSDNFSMLVDYPVPIKVYTSLADLLAVTPTSYDDCIALVRENGASSIWVSDTFGWKPLNKDVASGSLTHTGTTDETVAICFAVPADLLYEGCIVRAELWADGLHQTAGAATLRYRLGTNASLLLDTEIEAVSVGAADNGARLKAELLISDTSVDKAAHFWNQVVNSTASEKVEEDYDVNVEALFYLGFTIELANSGDDVRLRWKISLDMPNRTS